MTPWTMIEHMPRTKKYDMFMLMYIGVRCLRLTT